MKKSSVIIITIVLIGAVIALLTLGDTQPAENELPVDSSASSMISPMGMIEGVAMQVKGTDTPVSINESDLVSSIFTTSSERQAARAQFATLLGYDEAMMAEFWADMNAAGDGTTIGDWVETLNAWYLEPATDDYIENLGAMDASEPGAQPEIGLPANEELGGVWVWQETRMNNDVTTTPENPEEFTLTFGAEGVYGTTDCNNFNGSYAVDSEEGTIEFGPFAMTRMACPDSQEMAFTENLAEITNYMISDAGQLILMLRYDSGSMIFEPAATE